MTETRSRKAFKTCLMTLICFCLVLTGVFIFAPLEAEAAVGGTFTMDNVTYMVLSESGEEGTVTVSGSTVSEQGAVTIPSSVTNGSVTYTVTAIGANAFYGNTNITAIELPNTLTTIGAGAFNGCTGITKVEIPASVTSIGVNAFANCTALDEVRVYSKTVNIGATAFPSTVEEWYVYSGSTAETYAQNNSEGLTKIASLYDVTFNYNYGTAGSFTVKPLAVGETLRLPRDFSTIATRKGHTIVSLTCNDGNTYNKGIANMLANTVAMIEGGLTFTVNWEANTYTVTLDPNGGDYEATTVEVTFGPKVPSVSNHYPYRAGYTFDGYYKNATGPTGVQYYDSDMNPTEYGWAIDHDDTLYARWTPNTYSVSYDLDGGTHEECVDFTATYGESYTLLPDTVPTKEGYTFDHWAYSYAMDGYIVEMDDEMIGQEAPFEFDEDLTFVAVWKERSPVRFEISKGAKEQEYFLNASYVHFGGTLYYDNGEKEYLIVYEEEIAGFSTAAIQKEPVTATVTKQGCTDTFTYTVGYDYANCAHTWVQNYAHEVQCQHCETRVLLLGNSKEYDGEPMVAELKVLNGEFDTSSLTIAYGTEDGQPPSGLGVHNALVMIGDGYIQNTLSIYSYYTAEFYFEDLNGEYVIDESMTARKQSLGYTDQMFNTPFGFVQQSYEPIPIEPDGSTVLKLYYDREVANVTLYPNGGAFENGESVQIQVKYGTPFWDAVQGVEIPERDRLSYKFLGWTLDGILITEDDERTMSLNDVELFASWQERVVVGIEIPEDKLVQWYSKLSTEKFREFEAFIRYADNSTEPITVTENMLTGFDLSVLTPLDEYCTATVNYGTFSANFTYYVRYISQIEYYVKLDEGYYESDVLDYYEGQTITLMDDDAFERVGYTFYGWSDSTNGGTYAAGEEYTLQSGDTVLSAVWKLNAPTLTSNVGDTLEFVYDGIARDVTITAEHELGNQVTYTYNWYKGNCNPILPPGAEQVWSLGDVIFEGQTYAFVNVSQCYDDLYKERGLYYYIEVIAAHGENTSKYVYTLYVNIEKGDQTITLSEDEFTYSEGLTIDFADYVSGAGDEAISYAVSAQNGVTFDFANGVVSNITKAGGTFTLTVNKAASDNYNAATQTFTVTLNKGTQTLSASGEPSEPTWKQQYQIGVSGNEGALSYAVARGNGTVNNQGVITAFGAGQIDYKVIAAETDLYEAATQTFTVIFGKAAGNLAPDYVAPSEQTICAESGDLYEVIAVPDGWYMDTIKMVQSGVLAVTATFTPSDTVNYDTYVEEFTVYVEEHAEGDEATCTTPQICTRCNTVLAEALGHDFSSSAWTDLGESGHAHKCSRCDEYDEAVPHSSEDEATCTTSQTCDFCGYVMEPSGDHSFTEVVADEAHLKAAATCVSGATYWYDCVHCDAISDTLYYTAGKPNEHDFDSNGVCEDCGAHELSYQIVDQSSGSDDVYVQFSAGQKISVFRDGFVIDTVLADGTVIPGEFVEIEWADYYFSGSTDQPMYFYALNKAQFDANEYDYGTQKKQFVVDMHQMTLTSPEGQSPITISPNVWLVLDVHGYNSVTGLGAYAVNVLSAPENSETLWFEVWSTGSGGGQVILQSQATNSFAKPSSPILQGITDRTTSNYRRSSSSSDSITYTYKIHTPSANCENISSPTCRTPATCTHCGTVIDPTLDENVHVWSAPCDTTCNEGCGTTRAAGEHTYDDCCDAVCNSEECGFERELTAHVHIGNDILMNGQYLDEEGNVSAMKPTGGYAHLAVSSEGTLTLTLHDFTYEGNAYYSNVEDLYAVIYSALDLTVKVEGENLLFVNEFEGESYLISIVVNGNLTVKGDGKATSSLEIGASAELMYGFDPLYAYNDLMIENVSVKAIDAEYGISGESILITGSELYLATLQDCVSAYGGDIKILNSVLELYSTYSYGIYIGSAEALLIERSEVYIHAWIGIYAPEELSSCTVTNSNLTVYCYDNAILCSTLEATDSNISITGMASAYNGENDAMISASSVELEDCTLYIDTNNYCGLEADVASFVSCDIFVYGSYGGLYAGELTLEGCTLVSEGENYGALGADALRIVGGSLTSDFVLADAYKSFTVEGEAQLNGIVYVYDPDTQTTTVTVYGEACVGKEQWLDLSYDDINWQAIAGLRVDGWLYLPEGVTGQQIAELGLAGDGMIVCGYGDQAAYYDTSGNPLYHYEYEGDLDFSNVGDGEGQTPAVGNGYSFNADTLTLTLTNFTIRGDLYLPHGNVTVVLNGYVEVYGSIYLAEGEGNALISLEGDGWLWVDEGVEIMHESVLTSEMELSLEIGENVTLHVDDYVTATSLSVYGRLEINYVYIYAMHGGGLRIGDGGVVVATGCLEIALSIGEEPNAADVDPWDYVVIDGGHLSGGIIPVYGVLDGAYGIFFVPEGLETNYYWYGQRAFVQSLPIESHVYGNDCDTTCDVCGAERTIAHDFTGEWQKDASGHWHVCETEGCTVTDTKAGHTSSGSATEDTPETCTVCGFIITPATGHINHTSSGEYGYDANGHWFKCVGCESEKLSPAGHNFDNACDVDCICGYQRTIEHDYTELKFNDTHHWYECSVCGAEQSGSRVAHNGGDATCEAKAICSCGQSYGGYGSHRFGQWQEEIPATCVATGTKEHKTCSTCEKHFAEDGVTEINDLTIAIDSNNHDIATEWTGVENGHYHKCKRTGCEYHTALEDHQPDRSEATEDEPIKCSVCEYIITPATGHITHTSSGIYGYDANGHWFKCVGCESEKVSPAEHSFDNDCDTDCACGYVRTITHNFTGEWQKDENGHWHVCATNGCTATDAVIGHTSSGEATEQTAETCTVCGFVITPATGHITHTSETEWQKNETHHWHECTGCDGQELEKAAHNDGDNNGSCDACGYTMSVTPPHNHSFGTTWVTDANNHWKECECEEKIEFGAHVDGNGDNKCDTCDYAMPETDPDNPDDSNNTPDNPNNTPDDPSGDDEGGLGTGAIIAIVAASVVALGGGGFALYWFVIRKKRVI